MHVNPLILIKNKRKPTTFQKNNNTNNNLDPMYFEIKNSSTTVSTTSPNSINTVTTTKKQSFRQVFIHPPPSPSPFPSPYSSSNSLNKRRPLLPKRTHSISSSSSSCCSGRFAELAGETTAECAAVCCCCPCGLVNLLYLTIYKVPASLCKKALRKKRKKQLVKKGLLTNKAQKRCKCGCDDMQTEIHFPATVDGGFDDLEDDEEDLEDDEDDMMKLEKEMWETFYSTGFWRSSSQRDPPSSNVIKENSSDLNKVKPL